MEVTMTIAGEARVALRVARVAEVMAERIEANTSKGGWAHLTPPQIMDQLRSHVHEFDQVVTDMVTGKDESAAAKLKIEKTMADVQNYAFFLADNLLALDLEGSTATAAGVQVEENKVKVPEAAAESKEGAEAHEAAASPENVD